MYTNNSNIPLPLAVWLLHDEYDYIRTPNYISATGLMKPIRHIVLPRRIPVEQRPTPDVVDLIPSALGHSLHDSIEKAWVRGHRNALLTLGYPEAVVDRVKINPEPGTLQQGDIPVYLEQREIREITVDGVTYKIGGKFDMVAEGIVHDNKSTTAYTWVYGGKDDDYKIQGSIYRWLNPDKITADFIRICFIFTDWQRAQAKQNPKYPQSRLEYKDIPLMTVEETEAWIVAKLRAIAKNKDLDEPDVVECTNQELWISDPQYKYYSDPTKTSGRSTKNFESSSEARKFMAEKGGKGVIITIPGTPKRCEYCDAAPICSQRKRIAPDGT